MHTVELLTLLVDHNHVIAYILIFFGLIFEGEIVLIFSGILSHLGALNIYSVLIFVLIGALTKTFLGYYVGEMIHNRWHQTKILKYIEKKVHNIMPHFSQRPFWSIFISKFIFGLNYMVIIFSGYKKINYKKYLIAEFIATAIWIPLLLSLGYFFSYTALYISKEIWSFSFVVLILIILFVIFDKLIGWLYEIFEEFYED